MLIEPKRNQWLGHLPQQLLPVVCHCVRALHLRQESVVALTDVEFKLGDLRIVTCDPEDTLSLDVLHLILPEVAHQEPKDKRSLQVVHVLPTKKLI